MNLFNKAFLLTVLISGKHLLPSLIIEGKDVNDG
jgi:hypothetical protein